MPDKIPLTLDERLEQIGECVALAERNLMTSVGSVLQATSYLSRAMTLVSEERLQLLKDVTKPCCE